MNEELFLWIPALLLLFAGRKFFWLAVALIGFFFGLELAVAATGGQSEWVRWMVALFIGLLAAVLAVFFKRVAIAVFGFAAGSYIILEWVHSSLPAEPAWLGSLVVVVAGVAGAILASLLFDSLLVVLTALSGAVVVADLLPVAENNALWLIPVLGAMGMAVQFGLLKPARREPRKKQEK